MVQLHAPRGSLWSSVPSLVVYAKSAQQRWSLTLPSCEPAGKPRDSLTPSQVLLCLTALGLKEDLCGSWTELSHSMGASCCLGFSHTGSGPLPLGGDAEALLAAPRLVKFAPPSFSCTLSFLGLLCPPATHTGAPPGQLFINRRVAFKIFAFSCTDGWCQSAASRIGGSLKVVMVRSGVDEPPLDWGGGAFRTRMSF